MSEYLLMPQEKLPSWKGSVCAQYWDGVICNGDSVAAIVLPSRRLQGERFAVCVAPSPSKAAADCSLVMLSIPSGWLIKYPSPNLLCRDLARVMESSCQITNS